MKVREEVPLAPYTTLRLGGTARRLVEVTTCDEMVDAVAAADAAGEPVLVLGGGSNVVLPDAGVDATVLLVRTAGVRADPGPAGGTRVSAAAGEDWDAFVAGTVAQDLAGMECLSGIPGLVGASPIQNVGAYGQDVAQTCDAVTVYDRAQRAVRVLAPAECGFAYRRSIFKGSDRYVVLDVAFDLQPGPLSGPIRYAELARTLGVELGARAPLGAVRDAVLTLRRGKGMVVDPADPDATSVGSFFTNPILAADDYDRLRTRVAQRLGEGVEPPHWPDGDHGVKVSAAWLIEQSGFHRGHGRGAARISTKHTLALTNRGGATAGELLDLAREVRDGVWRTFGVALDHEPVLVGAEL